MLAAVVIYFQMYWHIWLITLLGGYVMGTIPPIAILVAVGCVPVAVGLLSRAIGANDAPRAMTIPLLLYAVYVGWATWSVVVNEPNAIFIRRYLIYVYSPVAIFVAIMWTYRLDAGRRVTWLVSALAAIGVLLSIYVARLYLDPTFSALSQLLNVETEGMTVLADSGATYGMDAVGLWAKRFTIPGISSTTYGPMMVPLVLALLLLARQARGLARMACYLGAVFLGYCVLMTVSRGPMVAMFVALGYLAWRRGFNRWVVAAGAAGFVIAGLTFARLSFLRVIVTVVQLLPIDASSGISRWAYDLVPAEDPRFKSAFETVGFAAQSPWLGIGASSLIERQGATFGKEHNNYLSILAAFGGVAALAYVGFVVSLIWTLHRRALAASDPHEADIGTALTAGAIALAVYANFAPADFHFIWVWYGLSAAWILGTARPAPTEIAA